MLPADIKGKKSYKRKEIIESRDDKDRLLSDDKTASVQL